MGTIKREKVACFTGHRPNHLPFLLDESDRDFKKFKRILKKIIEGEIKNGISHFISGMAIGFDTLAAEIVLELKNKYDITLECAIPCKNQDRLWNLSQKNKYESVLKKADKVTLVSDFNYFNGCMQIRNRYMIESSSVVIALFNNSYKTGGTKSTVDYGIKKGLKIIILDPISFDIKIE